MRSNWAQRGAQRAVAQFDHVQFDFPIDKDARAAFRLIGLALSGECPLSDEEWRKSRRALAPNPSFRLESACALGDKFTGPEARKIS
jgi:hypothetical protein